MTDHTLFYRKGGAGRGQQCNVSDPEELDDCAPRLNTATDGRVALQNHLFHPLPHRKAVTTSGGRHLWHQYRPALTMARFSTVPVFLRERP